MQKIFYALFIYMLVLISCNNYSVKILKQLSTEYPEDNILLSPLNLFQMITLLANGAKGETQKELLEVIKYPNVMAANKKLEEYLGLIEFDKEIIKANGMMTKYTPTDDFLNKSKIIQVDVEPFPNSDQIGKWCNTKTSGKITKVIDKVHHLHLLLINALCFKGILKYQFDLSYIKQGVFFSSKGNQFTQMMSMTVEARFYQNWNEQIIELLYNNDNLVVTIILPKRGINSYVDQLRNKINIFKGIGINKSKVHLTVPKFTVDYATSLVKIMKTLETKTPFDRNNADFSNMTEHEKLFIEEFMHVNHFEFSNEGSQPALQTQSGINFLSETDLLETNNPVMAVNKPFILIVQHKDIPEEDLLFGKITSVM